MKNTARKTRPTEDSRPQLRTTLGDLARAEADAQLALGLRDLVRENLREFVISAGTAALTAVLEAERTRIAGPRYAHLPTRAAVGRPADTAVRRRNLPVRQGNIGTTARRGSGGACENRMLDPRAQHLL